LALDGCADASKALNIDEQRIPVRVTRVATREYVHTITGSGLVVADRTVQLAFKTGGIIAALAANEGDKVGKGQLLARLDLAENRASAQMSEAALAKARRDAERTRALFDDGVATEEQLQDATTALEVARSNREIAVFNLKHSTIRAPDNGRIQRRLAEKGELIAPGQPVYVFGCTSRAWMVRIGVSDRDIVLLREGAPATVVLDAHPGHELAATVSELAAAADPASGTFEVELELAATDLTLLPGMVARLRIEARDRRQVPFIPFSAVTEGHGRKAHIFVADETSKRARRVEIEVLAIVGGEVAVAGGIDAHSLVVTEGSAYLQDADAIRIVSAASTGGDL
jgi:RND family efflux transporter MFP subunit